MAQFFSQHPPQQQQPAYSSGAAQNLQFYPSTYGATPVSGHTTPSQASYGAYGGHAGGGANAYAGASGFGTGFGGGPGVSGRMGEQGGLRTGWLAAFGTEGYDGEPTLLEELGVNFSHIKGKVSLWAFSRLDWHGEKLTMSAVDAHGPESSGESGPAYHGRL